MSELKISCLSIDCPERNGGICRWDPRSPRTGAEKVRYNLWQQAWDKVEDIIAEFGDDPENCLAIITEHIDAVLHGKKEFEQ